MRIITLWVLLLLAITAHANEQPENPWKVGVEFGVEDDSNVVVDDNDSNTDSDNLNRQSKLSLGYNHKMTNPKIDSSFGYTFFSNDYQTLDAFDSKLHLFNFKTSRKFADVKLGLSAQWVDSSLDHNDFLQLKQVGTNASYFINKTNYLYSAVKLGRKTFAQDSDRNANQRTLSANYYRLFNGLNHYVLIGGKLKYERAQSQVFSYDLAELKAQYVYRKSILTVPTKVSLGYRYQKRDYANAWHPDINKYRKDRRHQLFGTLRLQWNNQWYSELSLVHNANDSNLAFADYDQSRISFLVGFELK
jgi:hypothetical protein